MRLKCFFTWKRQSETSRISIRVFICSSKASEAESRQVGNTIKVQLYGEQAMSAYRPGECGKKQERKFTGKSKTTSTDISVIFSSSSLSN